jgi:hypothetical protein
MDVALVTASHEQMHMIGHDIHLDVFSPPTFNLLSRNNLQSFAYRWCQHLAPVLGAEHHLLPTDGDDVAGVPHVVHADSMTRQIAQHQLLVPPSSMRATRLAPPCLEVKEPLPACPLDVWRRPTVSAVYTWAGWWASAAGVPAGLGLSAGRRGPRSRSRRPARHWCRARSARSGATCPVHRDAGGPG